MRNHFKKILIILILFSTIQVFGQQKPMFTQYMSNLQPTNAAYVGTSGKFNVMLLSRFQWVGFEGSPNSQMLMLNTPLVGTNLGLGLTVINDMIGPLRETGGYLDVAYNIKIKDDLRLSMGVKGGINFMVADLGGLELTDPNDPAFATDVKNTEFLPNFGAGLYLYSPKFYVGISAPELYKHNFAGEESSNIGEQQRHVFFIAGFLWDISENLKFKPSGLLKIVPGAPPSFDINASFFLILLYEF